MSDNHWETKLADLLKRLSSTQKNLLSLLASKRELLLANDSDGLARLVSEEEALSVELQSCFECRKLLLQQAADQGLPATNIRELAGALPRKQAQRLQEPIDRASGRARLLRHQSLSQWVVVQRTLLHLSQMLEIIATGGRAQPTYEKDSSPKNQIRATSGSLMDQAV
jgi:hypothetical protein